MDLAAGCHAPIVQLVGSILFLDDSNGDTEWSGDLELLVNRIGRELESRE